MHIIKLHPDQDGSVWYIPEGLPGIVVIRNHGYTVFMIKKLPGSDYIPECYYLKDKICYFSDKLLYKEWGYGIHSETRFLGFYIPDGYRINWMHDYDIVNDQHIPVNVYIEGQLNFLNQVYSINQPALTRVRRWFISKMK